MVLLLALLVVAFVATCVYWYRVQDATSSSLIARLPADAALISVDFAALRRAGILESFGAIAEEPDYKAFVERTRFDYKRDLDAALLALSPHGKYFLLRGRFDWKALNAYASAEGGACQGSLCRMTGSQPDRKIGFFPLQDGILAMAVAPDPAAVESLRLRGAPVNYPLPDAPIWVALSPAAIRSGEGLPTGTRMFARSMEKAQSVTLALAPEGSRFALRLDVRCRGEQEAADIAGQLTHTTEMLRDFIAREHQTPNPGDLSGVLTSGAFRAEGKRVNGYWPIERAFLDNLLAGGPR